VIHIKPGIKYQSVSARFNFKFTTGRSAFQISTRTRDLSLSQNVQTDNGAHAASCTMGTGVFTRGQGSRDVKLVTLLHIVPRLRMSGSIPFLSIYSFLACTGTTSPLRLHYGLTEHNDYDTQEVRLRQSLYPQYRHNKYIRNLAPVKRRNKFSLQQIKQKLSQ
jgi:hypothetical protein